MALIMNLVLLVITILICCYFYFKRVFTYWSSRKIVCASAPSIPFGHLDNPFRPKKAVPLIIADHYAKLKAEGQKHFGFYILNSPNYVPIDMEIIKSILVKDFSCFMNRGMYYNEKDEPISAHLFAIEDEKWKTLRMKLNQTFTVSKIKTMFETMLKCTESLEEFLRKMCEHKSAIDVRQTMARYTTDVIGSCAFGLECNCFTNEDADFRKFGWKAVETTLRQQFTIIAFLTAPKFCEMMKLNFTEKSVSNFFLNVVRETITYREENKIVRDDFLQILIDMKNSSDSSMSLTFEEIAAQVFVFFLGGFETSSSTINFALYELAIHPDIQVRTREEITEVLAANNGKITFESLKDMPYLQQVIDETLRKYPPLPMLNRICKYDYHVPGSDLVLEKGTKIVISNYGIQNDPEYYPHPEIFDPDRFSEENRANVIPFTNLWFGEGPRICIGLRFGLVQIKLGLISVLKNYKFKLSSKSPEKMEFNKFNFVLTSECPIHLDLERIN